MGIFNEFNKKEKPVFTGSRFGFGAGDRPTAAGGTTVNSVIASGGAVQSYTDGSTTYRVHIFANGDSDFVYTSGPGSIDVMVMGGGGGGGGAYGDQDTGKGGGGAGGLAWASAIPISPGTTCPVTVGAGGRGHYGAVQTAERAGRNGSNSVFVIPSGPYTITGAGGGGGGVSDTASHDVSPTRVPNTNTNAGSPGGSGGGGGARGSANSSFAGGGGTQPGLNPGMPWVTNYGFDGGGSESNPSGSGGGGGGVGGGGSDAGSPGPNGGAAGNGKSNFVGPASEQKAFFLGTKGLGMGGDSDPHAYATPSSPAVYFGGGGSGAPGTSGSNFSYPLGRGGTGGGGRAGLGRNVGQTGPLDSTLPSAYWYQIGGANHHGGGGGGASDDPEGPSNRKQSGGFAGKGGHGVVVVRYEVVEGNTNTFVAATGGTTSTDGDYKVHKFDGSGTSNTPGTFTITQKSDDSVYNTIEVLVVGGGGSGGRWSGGGGGAGGVAHTYNYSLDHPAFPGSGPWSIPLQAGGGGAAVTVNGFGNAGNDSYFGPTSLRVYALGGGAGGSHRSHPAPGSTYTVMDGGSGGGGTAQDRNSRAGMGQQRDIFGADPGAPLYSNKLQYNEKIVIYNYGNAGGQGPTDSNADNGGGGGAGAAGADGGPGSGYSPGDGRGGDGIVISITGSPVAYGGGGTAASPPNSEAGGSGGGGTGGGPGAGGAGTDGLGGGGGGAYSGAPGSGRGGAGTVIVRYKYQ